MGGRCGCARVLRRRVPDAALSVLRQLAAGAQLAAPCPPAAQAARIIGGPWLLGATMCCVAQLPPQPALLPSPSARRLSIAAQLYIVCSLPRYFHGWCAAGGPLAQPGLLHDAHRLFQGARALLLGSASPYWLPPPAEPPGQEAQCRCLLTFLLLSGGLALPLLLEAARTARLFEQHQQERREAQLPAERGMHARIYSSVHGLFRNGPLPLVCACFGALVVCWDISTLASLPVG